MTGDGFVLGVDLGTSNTVAMLRHPDGRTRPLLFDGQPLLPSAAYLDTTGRLHVGSDALRLGQAEPARVEPHPKSHVDDGAVLLVDTSVPVSGRPARRSHSTGGKNARTSRPSTVSDSTPHGASSPGSSPFLPSHNRSRSPNRRAADCGCRLNVHGNV